LIRKIYMNNNVTDAAGFLQLFTETSFAPASLWAFTFQFVFFFLGHKWMAVVIAHFSILDEWLLQLCCWFLNYYWQTEAVVPWVLFYFGINETSSLPKVKKLHLDLNVDIEVLKRLIIDIIISGGAY
jgi:hypothetical protein